MVPKKYISSILYLLFTLPIIGQNSTIDSLIRESKKTSIPDSVRIKLYGDISWLLMSIDIDRSFEYANEELNLAKVTNRETDIAQAESDIGNIYNRKTIFDTALIHYEKALSLRKKLNQDLKVAGIYSNIATIYIRQNDYKKALEIYFKSLKIFEKYKDEIKQASTLGNIGHLYYELKQIELAELFHRKSYTLAHKLNDPQLEGNALINIGGMKFEKGAKDDSIVNRRELDSALYFFNEAENILQKTDNAYSLSSIYNNKGRIYVIKKEYSNGILSYQKALKMRELLEDQFGKGSTLISLAEAELLTGDTKNNIIHLNMASEIFHGLKNHLKLKEVYAALAKTYKINKDYYSCLKYYELYVQYNDSVFNENSANQIAELQTKYDVEKKDLEISKNKAEIENEKNKRYITYGALVFFVLLLSIAIWAFVQKRKNNRLLEAKNSQLETANDEISHQKNIIEEKQKEIVDSINYAKKIQNALLASEEMLLENAVNHFILFKPKDIVSGDFTWATKRDHLIYLACCDSTGHGVPGAFMSLLNIGFLSEAIKERNITEPGKIFDYVRDRLIETIGKDEQKDGFDGTLLCVDLSSKKITYASAHNAPLLISNEEINILKCDKMPVGKGVKEDSFNTYTINFQSGDSLYLFTDGYPDQFGGPKGKKFKYKQLEEILLKNSSLALKDQHDKLIYEFDAWKGNLEQVDDVCIIGIKL